MYQVESRTTAEQPTLVMIGKVQLAEIPAFLGKAFAAVAQHIGMSGSSFAGPPFARYRILDDPRTEFEVEAGFPVERPTPGRDDVVSSTLPGGTLAVVTHFGPYDQMQPAYQAVLNWLEETGAQPAGAPWEIYYSDPQEQSDPRTWRTEICQPYLKV